MFAKVKDNQLAQYPYGWNEFVADNNNTNYGADNDLLALFPATDVAQQGYECVEITVLPPPQIDDRTQRLQQAEHPSLIDGCWTLDWFVIQKSAEELQTQTENQAKSIRADRNAKLASSDWTQVADAPVDKAVWATYRQALRDIPSQAGFPWEVQWPTQP